MDLFVERQCIEQMKSGDTKKFLMLFDANFEEVYKYVMRRVPVNAEAESITRMVFMDALGQIERTPQDLGYNVWLYSLARPRVWDYMSKASFPQKQGLISAVEDAGEKEYTKEIIKKADHLFTKLLLEEREILRLKFFEQVSDGDVMYVLNSEEASIGPKIYRVLKRSHFMLFGESDERHGVYFGEISSFMEQIRQAEVIEVPETFKATLRVELENKINRKDFAVEAEEIVSEKEPFQETPEFLQQDKPKGSNDPAKIFVEAVREMREEEEQERVKQQQKLERQERVYEFLERYKVYLVALPVLLFVVLGAVVFFSLFNQEDRIVRGYSNSCSMDIEFTGDFSDSEIRSVHQGISNRLCDHFTVEKLVISRLPSGEVGVKVDVPEWFYQYGFKKNPRMWKIYYYEKTARSNSESGEV